MTDDQWEGDEERITSSRNQTGTCYEIRLQGRLSTRWVDWFDGLSLAYEAGVTVLNGPVVDQAALHGLLQTIRDLGLPLISVRQVDLDTTNQDNQVPA